jgi:DNA-binding GntR family transcriptional regulator
VNRAALPIRVDRNSPVPLYFQVAQYLEQMIESGELPMGTRLDNENNLAGQLGLSKPTMRRAIEYLVGRGLLVRKRGIGTQVVHVKITREMELTSLYDDLAKTGPGPVHHRGSASGPSRRRTRSRPSSDLRPGRRCTSSSGCGRPTPSRSR